MAEEKQEAVPQDEVQEPPIGVAYFAKMTPDKTALICDDLRMTYRELDERANRFGNGMADRGLKAGERISVLLHNCPEYYMITNGLRSIGAGIVPIGYRLQPPEIEYIVSNSDSRGIVFGEEFTDRIDAIRGNLEKVGKDRYIVVGENVPSWAVPFEDFLADSSPEAPGVVVDPLDEAGSTMIYTSGTTGRPKGVARFLKEDVTPEEATLHATAVTLVRLVSEFDLRGDDVHILVCPFYHSAPLAFSSITISLGGTVVIMRKFDGVEMLRLIEKEKVTTTFVVPTVLNRVLAVPEEERAKYDISSMRVMIVAAAPLHTKTKEGTLDCFGNVLYEFYGSTEAGINTLLKPEDQRRKIRCVGKVYPGNEIKLLDADGNEVPQNQVGEMYIKTDGGFSPQYHKNPDATEEGYLGEYFSVGDMAWQDEEGYYYLVDRSKDMVISGGVNVYPVETENVINLHPKVFEAAVIGVPDEAWGEVLKAVVVLKEGEAATEEEIIGFCEGELASYKRPSTVDFVDELPRNPQGKLLKRVLREKYWKGKDVKI